MQIDWLTVAAQAVNFLILVYLLRRFLYRPVMAAMARRQQRIAEQLEQARAREQDAEREAQRHRQETETLARKREELLAAAAREVEERRKTMQEDARTEVEASRAAWRKEVEREREEFLKSFRQQAAAALTRTARRALADLAETELEQQLIRAFMKQLESLDHAVLATLRKSAHEADTIHVTTAFEANPDTRSRIKRAIQHHLLEGRETGVEFHRSDELICGIEVNTDGRKFGWTLADYLQGLEQDLDQALAATLAAQERSGA